MTKLSGDSPKTIGSIIGECIGEASMLWSEIPSGTFESTKAAELSIRVTQEIEKRFRLESLIMGHIEAMRPLLDEWSKTK